MGRTERLYIIQRLLNNQQAIPLSRFLETLEVSKATFKRDLEYLRDRLGAPIVWDAEASGYRLDIKSNQQIHHFQSEILLLRMFHYHPHLHRDVL